MYIRKEAELRESVRDRYFAADLQFRIKVIGAFEASSGWLIRKRPSRETIYSCLLAPEPGATLMGKSATGVPAAKVAPDVVIAEAINFPSPPIKKISLPSARHHGWMPPPVDTCHLTPRTGNGCTKTSNRPESFVSYATQ